MATIHYSSSGATPNDSSEADPSSTILYSSSGVTPDDTAVAGGQLLTQAGMSGLQPYFFNTQMNGGLNG